MNSLPEIGTKVKINNPGSSFHMMEGEVQGIGEGVDGRELVGVDIMGVDVPFMLNELEEVTERKETA